MNEKNTTPNDEPAPLDAFEQQWVDQLAEREPDLVRSEDAFVQAVMQQAETGSAPAVIARIGKAVLPYGVAAAVLLAAFVGWVVLQDNDGDATDQQPIAVESIEQPQPEPELAVAHDDQPEVELGELIADAKSTVTSPAANLTSAIRDVSDAISIDRLFEVLGGSVPDLQEILTPTETDNDDIQA